MNRFYDMRNYNASEGIPIGIGDLYTSTGQILASRISDLGTLFTSLYSSRNIPLNIPLTNNIEIYLCASRQLFNPVKTFNNRGLGIVLTSSSRGYYEVALNNQTREDMRIYYNGGSFITRFQKNGALPITNPPTSFPMQPDWVNMRVRVFNDVIYAKVWKGEPYEEPLEWTGEVAGGENLEFTAASMYMSDHGATSICRYVSLGLDGERAPLPVTRTITGQVLLPDNSPAQGSKISVLFRETSSVAVETLADVNGNFSIELVTGKNIPLQVIATDAMGNIYDNVGVDII